MIRTRTAVLLLLALATPRLVLAQDPAAQRATSPPPQDHEIEPDRPDVTNGPHLVPVGVLQVELGGLFNRTSARAHDSGTPFSVRVGVTPWLEARVDGDGFLSRTDDTGTERGMGNVQLGAKVRLLADREGTGLLALEPAVSVPLASARKGLGSGQSDVILTLLAGTDFLKRGHIDVNYGIGSLGAGEGLPRFTQHAASASTNLDLGALSPYVELYWFSRQSADGGHVAAIDGGAIYVIAPRLAIDGGIQAGLSADAPRVSAFGGLSFILADPHPRHAAHAPVRATRRFRAS